MIRLFGITLQPPAWRDASWWLLYTLLGFSAPTAIGISVWAAIGEPISITRVAGGGQFAISSTGLLMTTYYFVARPSPFTRLPLTEWFLAVSLIGLIIGIVLFMFAVLSIGGVKIDPTFYQWPSVGLFVVSLLLAFIAVGLDRTREIEEPGLVGTAHQTEQRRIEDEFDQTFSSEGLA